MTPRLHAETPLAAGLAIDLPEDAAHYLRSVLRLGDGAEVRLFNARDGEFAATLAARGKKGAIAHIGACQRAPAPTAPGTGLELAFAPIKRGPMEFLIQKGTELGVDVFQPVITIRTNSDRLRIDRLATIAREAAEQCGRLSVPELREPVRLNAFIGALPEGRAVLFCDEAGDDPTLEWGGAIGRAAPLRQAVAPVAPGAVCVLIGPEGGFAPEERAALRARTDVTPVSLGPRILRADTAALVAVALWQAEKGDLADS